MKDRYWATFDSQHPTRGVVLDERDDRFASFPTVAKAEYVAERLNAQELDLNLPQLAPLLVWRDTKTGGLLTPPIPDADE